MPYLRRYVTWAAVVASVAMLCCASDTRAVTLEVKSRISFERVIELRKNSDLTLAQGLGRRGETLIGAHPSVIAIGDSRGQIMNLSLPRHSLGANWPELQTSCLLKGAENTTCDNLPFAGEAHNLLFIDLARLPEIGAAGLDKILAPSFDVSIVYQ